MIQRIRCSCLGYQLYIYILVFSYGDFFAAVCVYVVDMISYYFVTFFQYLVIKLKLINDNVLNSYLIN
jgi:hypothetical protein